MEKRRESEAVNSTLFRINMERRERGASFYLQDEHLRESRREDGVG
jgi:hypothetical protein